MSIGLNRYSNLFVTKCGTNLSGIVSASYSLTNNITTLYKLGYPIPITSYSILPDIELTITGYESQMDGFDIGETNTFVDLSINGTNGAVNVSKAILSSMNYNFSIDGPFTVSKTYKGFVKKVEGGGDILFDDKFPVSYRPSWSGSLPNGISGNYLKSVSAQISINREYIQQFAHRQPYATIVSYPITTSITYEVWADSMDSVAFEEFNEACINPTSNTYDATISACGSSLGISKAHVTSISYNGGEARSGGEPLSISITFTSYEGYPGIKPVVYFTDDSCGG